MADPTTPYAIVDGAVLDPALYNDNLYDPAVAGRGLWSEPNGGLAGVNLAGGFLVQAEHVMPGETFRFATSDEMSPRDFYDDGIGAVDESDPADPSSYVPVQGVACRVYVPFRALVTWHWSFFMHPWRVLFDNPNGQGGNSSFEGFVQARVGGVLLPHARRRLTFTVLMQNDAGTTDYGAGGAGGGRFTRDEGRGCLHYGMHHVEVVASPGYRELDLMLYLQHAGKSLVLRRQQQGGLSGNGKWDTDIHTRATFGISHCFALVQHMPA